MKVDLMANNNQQRGEVPLIHREMSVEVARALAREIMKAFRYIEHEQYPELVALQNDLCSVIRQIEASDVKRPC